MTSMTKIIEKSVDRLCYTTLTSLFYFVSHLANILISKSTFAFAVADSGSWLKSQGEYAVDSIHSAVRPTPPIPSNVTGRSYNSSSGLDIREISGMIRMDMTDRDRVYEDARSCSSLTGLVEAPLQLSNVDYYTLPSTWNDPVSVLPSSGRQLISEPDSWYHCSSAPRTAIAHNRDLQSPAPRSSRDFWTGNSCSALSMPRSRSRSPIFKYDEPSSRHGGAISASDDVPHDPRLRSLRAGSSRDFLPDNSRSALSTPRSRSHSPIPKSSHCNSQSSAPEDVSHDQRLRSLEVGSSSNFSTDRRRSVLSLPRSRSHSPDSKFVDPSLRHGSVTDVNDNDKYLRDYLSAAEQSATCRKRQYQQQPICSSSSLLFNKKLAKLRELRYMHIAIFYIALPR